MSKKKKYKINYAKFATAMIILAILLGIIILGISRLFATKPTSTDAKVQDNTVVETGTNVASENTATNENINNIVDTTATKKERESRAISLKSGEKSKNSLAVLMYHYFYDESKGETAKNSNWMEISNFEKQLKYLKENDYYYPTWQEVADFVDGKIDLPEKSVVITMDDGHKSIYSLSIPMLDKYDIPATAFIITSKFDTKNLEKYRNSTIDFESHTNNMHRAGGTIGHGGIFPALSIEEGVDDLQQSIKKLGGNSGALAYPYGDCTESTKKAAKQAGFNVAFTTVNEKVEPGMDKYELPRVRMYTDISLAGFKASI